MPTKPACRECQRLWGEYLSALLEHARLDRLFYFVSLGQEPGSTEALSAAVFTAAIAKDRLREQIREHQQTHAEAASV
jgi:hypothetical protein